MAKSIASFDGRSQFFFTLDKNWNLFGLGTFLWWESGEARLEILEHDPLFLNTDLVQSRRLSPRVCEPNINIKAESVCKLCWATGVSCRYCNTFTTIFPKQISFLFICTWFLSLPPKIYPTNNILAFVGLRRPEKGWKSLCGNPLQHPGILLTPASLVLDFYLQVVHQYWC